MMQKILTKNSRSKQQIFPEEQEVEIIDNEGRPFMLMPLSQAQKHKLTRRIVFVSLQNTQKKVFLQKRSKENKYNALLWDISVSGHVYSNEASEDAARRELNEQLTIDIPFLYPVSTLPYTNIDGTRLLATVFTTSPCTAIPKINTKFISDSMFLDKDELLALAENYPELLTSELIWAITAGWVV